MKRSSKSPGKVHALILASGTGSRASTRIPKQFIKVAGKSLLEHTIAVFENHPAIDDIHVVVPASYRELAEELLVQNSFKKIRRVLNGGESRSESSRCGLTGMDDEDWVLIHDSVRPFVSHRIIDSCLTALEEYSAVDVAVPSPDTVIQVDDSKVIASIPDRSTLMLGQTPQAFHVGVIRRAHELFKDGADFPATDDCGLVVHYDLAPIKVVDGHPHNMKVTYSEDLAQADKLFQLRSIDVPGTTSLDDLKGKVVAVLGGSRGIGEEIVREAQSRGARVHSFSRENGVDVSDFDTVVKALDDAANSDGGIDIVINTAGVLGMGKLEDRPLEDIHREIAVNYLGSVHAAKAALPHLRQSRGALLLFTSSSYSRGRALYSTYSSSKAALVNLTQALAEELAHTGVRVNIINPERTATPMRTEAFGVEPEGSLLSAVKVAEASLHTVLADLTGQVIDVVR